MGWVQKALCHSLVPNQTNKCIKFYKLVDYNPGTINRKNVKQLFYPTSIFSLYLFLLFPYQGMAQPGIDCVTAIEINSAETIIIDRAPFEGTVTEITDQSCFGGNIVLDLDINTMWFRYAFCSDGDFLFQIVPEVFELDIDFILFRSESTDCENLVGIRCMVSGENVGTPTDSACLGPTGLSYLSNDTNEGPGCTPGDDNFLSPLGVQTGDVLYLAVSAFSGVNKYSIAHEGTATFDCHPTSVEKISAASFEVYPNPASDYLFVVDAHNSKKLVTTSIYSADGRLLLMHDLQNGNQIPLSSIETGIYWIVVKDNIGRTETKKISVLRN